MKQEQDTPLLSRRKTDESNNGHFKCLLQDIRIKCRYVLKCNVLLYILSFFVFKFMFLEVFVLKYDYWTLRGVLIVVLLKFFDHQLRRSK